MQRSVFASAALCLLFATLYSGCVFYEEDCDYVETQCWDVVDVYCDAWGCWEELHTECEEYCVNVAEPVAPPECTSDRHCAAGYICEAERCVVEPVGNPGAGLCEACDLNGDCAEDGALCLNLTEDAAIGYCGSDCTTSGACPSGFECVALDGASGNQCVPLSRSCIDSGPSCDGPEDCFEDEVCESGYCVDAPEPECTENSECSEGQVCTTEGECVDRPVECTDGSECDNDEACVDGVCTPIEACETSEECTSPDICVDGVCGAAECTENAECDDHEECVDGVCEEIQVAMCQRNSDCAEDALCVDGSCRTLCEEDDQCAGNQVCRAGLCSPPPEPECTIGADCGGEAGDFFCVNGTCHASCSEEDVCDFGYVCRGFYCDADPDVECRNDLECGLGELCIEGECLIECAASCNCPTGLSCDPVDSVCRDLPFPETCEDDCDCPGGYTCSEESTCVETTGG